MSPLSPRLDLAAAGLVLACLSGACEPELIVGKVTNDQEASCLLSGSDGGAPSAEDKIVEAPWTTGFEDGFCGYTLAGGFCYASDDASYTIVDEPVHGGLNAAAFSVTTNAPLEARQTRCVLQGALPDDAVYGAWFYIPAFARNAGNWNLFYFQHLVSLDPGLWSISLRSSDAGTLHLYVLGHLDGVARIPAPSPAVPIGSWFQVEFRLLRAADRTGEIALYQDGALLFEESGIVTDPGEPDQWYVGNWADALTPPESTIYVDDVTVREP